MATTLLDVTIQDAVRHCRPKARSAFPAHTDPGPGDIDKAIRAASDELLGHRERWLA